MIQISSNMVITIHANGIIYVLDGQDKKSVRIA
jgi:hypothetical protein